MKFFINFLTYFRLFSGPIIFALLLLLSSPGIALILFILASLSDYLDGYLARKHSLESTLGEIMDPIADKILALFLLITLILYFDSTFIAITGAVMLSRDFWINALRDYNSRNEQADVTKVTFLAKFKTASQFFTFGSFLLGIFLGNALIIFISYILLFTSMILSLQTALDYTKATFKN
jgi:CDP-diacylglycerol---glycerol-3-phosphate 3-phosphatidyltransferase